MNEMIQSIDREIERQTKALVNHKVFKAKFSKQDKYLSYASEEGSGLCSGCCGCLSILR
jgi:hypothetical protein